MGNFYLCVNKIVFLFCASLWQPFDYAQDNPKNGNYQNHLALQKTKFVYCISIKNIIKLINLPAEVTPVKKIFFNYADDEEDIKITQDLCLYFAVLKDKVSLWHKDKIMPGDVIKDALHKNLDDADAAVHILSVAYENENDCKEILDKSILQNKKNIPVLVSTFPWEFDDAIVKLKAELLPHDHKPVDLHTNTHVVYTEIVYSVKNKLFGAGPNLQFNQRGYYYLLAGIALAAGFIAAFFANDIFGSLAVSLLAFTMFACTALFILRKIIFPTSVSTSKF